MVVDEKSNKSVRNKEKGQTDEVRIFNHIVLFYLSLSWFQVFLLDDDIAAIGAACAGSCYVSWII